VPIFMGGGKQAEELYSEAREASPAVRKDRDPEQVKDAVTHSRVYTVFELMDAVSMKDCASSLRILKRYLEEEDLRTGPKSSSAC